MKSPQKTQAVLTLFTILLLSGCSAEVPSDTLESTVEAFHEQYNQGEFDEIYRTASNRLKNGTTQPDFVESMEELYEQLGNHVGSNLVSSSALANGLSLVVNAGYKSTFERGSVREHFIWKFRSKKAYLVVYLPLQQPGFPEETQKPVDTQQDPAPGEALEKGK